MDELTVNVAFDDDAMADADRCLDRLRTAGLQLVRYRRVAGVATGAVAADRLAALRRVQGVRSVEVDRPVKSL